MSEQEGTLYTTDEKGRKLEIRALGALDLLDLLEAAGVNAGNQQWLGIAMRACSVRSIDGVPIPMPVKRDQVRALVAKLDMHGLAAVSQALGAADEEASEDADTIKEAAKN